MTMDIRNIEDAAPIVEHNGTVPVWWMVNPRELRDVTKGGFLELVNEFEVPAVDGGLQCEVLFRHATHTQVVMPLDVAAVIVVAPAGADLDRPGGWEAIRAFTLPVLSSVVLHRGTWHWGPYPVEAESVQLFNVQGLRYREDNDRIDLAALGRSVDVVLA